MRELEWEQFRPLDSNVLTHEDLRIVWPRNKAVPSDCILGAWLSLPSPILALPPPLTAALVGGEQSSQYAPVRRLHRKTSVEQLLQRSAVVGPSGSQSSEPYTSQNLKPASDGCN